MVRGVKNSNKSRKVAEALVNRISLVRSILPTNLVHIFHFISLTGTVSHSVAIKVDARFFVKMYKQVDALRFKPSLWEFQRNSAPNRVVKAPDLNQAVSSSNP